MTTEDDFQKRLNRSLNDFSTRLVFADWLQERDDPRAAGYRALGLLRRRAVKCVQYGQPPDDAANMDYVFGGTRLTNPEPRYRVCLLPDVWFRAMLGQPATGRFGRRTNGALATWFYLPTRRESEDAAALAFGRLASVEQTAILAASLATPIPATL